MDEACDEGEEYAQEGDDGVVHACFFDIAAWKGNVYVFLRWGNCGGVIFGSCWMTIDFMYPC